MIMVPSKYLSSQAYDLSSDPRNTTAILSTPRKQQRPSKRKMESQPMTAGRRWFRLASLAQLNAPVQGPTQAQTAPAQVAQGSGQGPSRVHTTPDPTQGPAPSSAPPAQAAAPRIPLPGLPSERAPVPPQPQPPPPPQTQQAPANNIVKGTQASQQPAPPSPSPGTPAHPQPQPQPPTSPTPRNPSQPPPPSPRSTIMARPLTPQPPESPKHITRTQPPTPTSESPRTRIPSPATESPKVITTLTTPEPGINRWLQPIRAPPPHPEPEPKPEPATNHKTASAQQGGSDGGAKTMADINGKQRGNSDQSHIHARSPPPPPSPRRETMINGEKKFITMAGENMGAYMELGSPIGQHTNRKQQQQQGYILQHQNKGIEPESEGEPANEKEGGEKTSATEGKPKVAVVNSNVQSVNNSVISRSSCTQQSPGVHATIISRRQPKHEGATHQ